MSMLKCNGNFTILILDVLCEGIIQNNFLTSHSPKRIWFSLVPGVLHLGYIYICCAKMKIWASPVFSTYIFLGARAQLLMFPLPTENKT